LLFIVEEAKNCAHDFKPLLLYVNGEFKSVTMFNSLNYLKTTHIIIENSLIMFIFVASKKEL